MLLSFNHACHPLCPPHPHLTLPHPCQMLSHPRRCGIGGGHHEGECRQGFGKGPEAFGAGWQGGRSPSRSLPVWKLCSQAKEQVLVEELQGGHISVGPLNRLLLKDTHNLICEWCAEVNNVYGVFESDPRLFYFRTSNYCSYWGEHTASVPGDAPHTNLLMSCCGSLSRCFGVKWEKKTRLLL